MPEPLAKIARVFADGRTELVDSDMDVSQMSESQSKLVQAVGATMKSYADTAKALAEGKYAAIKGLIPVNLSDPGRVLVVVCPDGAVIRFERQAKPAGVMASWSPLSLLELVPVISQQVVFCYTDRNYTSLVPKMGMTLTIRKTNATTNTSEEIASSKIGFDVVLERPPQLPTPSKPFCLLSVRNSLELQLLLSVTGATLPAERQALVRSSVRLPVQWDCVEVYPVIESDQWKPEYGPIWAENDILAAVVANQFQEKQFQTLDPKATARREWSLLLKSYKDLLDSNPECEETLQVFFA